MQSITNEKVATARPENVRLVLATMDSFQITLDPNGPASKEVWSQALAQILSKAEFAAWEEVLAERRSYRVAALAAIATAELDRTRKLAPKQCLRMQEVLSVVIDRHLPQLDSSRSSSTRWYLDSVSALLPVAGVEEAVLQEILSSRQWKAFKERDLLPSSQLWKEMQKRGSVPLNLRLNPPALRAP